MIQCSMNTFLTGMLQFFYKGLFRDAQAAQEMQVTISLSALLTSETKKHVICGAKRDGNGTIFCRHPVVTKHRTTWGQKYAATLYFVKCDIKLISISCPLSQLTVSHHLARLTIGAKDMVGFSYFSFPIYIIIYSDC